MPEYEYSTIIVGGGIAGLTSAAYLSRAQQKYYLLKKTGNAEDWSIHLYATVFILMPESEPWKMQVLFYQC